MLPLATSAIAVDLESIHIWKIASSWHFHVYMSESDLPESNTFRCCFQSHLDSWCSSEHALHRDGNQFPGTTLWNLMHRQQYTSVYNIYIYTLSYLLSVPLRKYSLHKLHKGQLSGDCIWSLRGDTHLVWNCRPGQLQLQVEVLQSLLRMKRSVLLLQVITTIHESRCKLYIPEISLSVILLMIYNVSLYILLDGTRLSWRASSTPFSPAFRRCTTPAHWVLDSAKGDFLPNFISTNFHTSRTLPVPSSWTPSRSCHGKC